MTACCILRLRLLPCFLASTSSRIKHFLYLPTMIQWATFLLFLMNLWKIASFVKKKKKKKVAEFVCSLHIASLMQLLWVCERAQWKQDASDLFWICSRPGWVTTVQLAAHIRTRRALGLQRTPMRMGVRSSVACIRSRPLCNTRAVPGGPVYKRFPVLCERLSRALGEEQWRPARHLKNPPVCMHSFSCSCELEGGKGKKRKKRRSREAEEKAKIARCINLHSPATSPQECVFVTDHTGGGLHVHFSGFLFKDDIKLLNSKTTIDPFFS